MTGKVAVDVWDVPTRLFHWMLVGLFAFSWWSAENREMQWHYQSGILLLALLIFRLIWGFVGGSTARFASFVKAPGKVLEFVRQADAALPLGHNPIGGYSVVALLTALIVQVGTGLFATDIDGLDSGPLSYLVGFDTGRVAAKVHEFAFDLLVILAGLHVLAILFYAIFHRRNLVMPMITGVSREAPESGGGLVRAGWKCFAIALFVAALIAWWVAGGSAA